MPSSIAFSASRTTVGSAHAPPIHPRTSRSGVIRAVAPSLPDDGARRHTTVASTYGSTPRRELRGELQDLRLHAPPALRRLDRLPDLGARKRHVDVLHAERLQRVDHRVDVRGGRADRGRLADALGADRVVRRRRHRLAQLEPRRLDRGRQQVVHEVRADAVAVLVERDQLHRRRAVALGEPAVDLALDDHRVDAHAAVVDRDHALDLPLAGLGVDLDRDRVRAERERQVRRVVVVVAFEARPPCRRGSSCTRRTRRPGS